MNRTKWDEYYMRRTTNTDDMYPASLDLALDRFERFMRWLVWGVTVGCAAGIAIFFYEVLTKHL